MMTELRSVPTESETIANLSFSNEVLTERLAELEYALEREGWTALTGSSEREFSRDGLQKINALARLNYLKNPLIRRGVDVQTYYVFGQGCEIGAEDEEVNAVIQAFLADAKNQAELTSHQALVLKEAELTLFGNLFFVFFVTSDGRVRVRTLPTDEITDIITNPEDAKDPWWYRREWEERGIDGVVKPRVVYYPDWRYTGGERPDADTATTPVYHVKVGCLSDMRFGVSEVYAALDWAKAYKSFLEDWATITRAYSRFAWQLTTKTKQGVVNAKAKLGTTLGSTTTETNPPPVTGSVFIGQDGVGMSPIRTAGATTSAEDGRRIMLMVASVMGLPESFFGDVSVGNLATAKSLDRPTELKFVNRRSLWSDVISDICQFVVMHAVKAGRIAGAVVEEDDGTPLVILPTTETNPETGEPIERDATVKITFPPILEHDVNEAIDAIVKAATLSGSSPARTIDMRTVSRMLLTALGERDIEAVLNILYPPGEPLPEQVEPEPVVDEEPDEEEPEDEEPEGDEDEEEPEEAADPDDPHGERAEWAQTPKWMQAARDRTERILGAAGDEHLKRALANMNKITDEEWAAAAQGQTLEPEAERPQ